MTPNEALDAIREFCDDLETPGTSFGAAKRLRSILNQVDPVTATRCLRCGADPAAGYAHARDLTTGREGRYCHGGTGPDCYTLSSHADFPELEVGQ